ncbi:Ig-like domain-containing protein, partial [Mesorhizobium japonicum]|uniref:Ig-like domain-containing protein n=1 Tax=Mesorhizobium japonicum TaxID=2066070 RepID=UPI003B5C972B
MKFDYRTAKVQAGVIVDEALANGKDQNEVAGGVTDAHDNPLSGVRVGIKVAAYPGLQIVSAETDQFGMAIIKVTSTQPGLKELRASAYDPKFSALAAKSEEFDLEFMEELAEPIVPITVNWADKTAQGVTYRYAQTFCT